MFNTYEFTYAGMPASLYGMYVADIGSKKHSANPFGTKANLIETRIANRIKPIHFGVRYHDEPLSFPLIFGADHILDRYEMQAVSKWLMGYQEYQWLTIDQPDMEGIQFRCFVRELTPIHHVWLPMAFEASIVCDCPYGYSPPFERFFQVSGTSTVLFHNNSTCRERLKPILTATLNANCTNFSVENQTTGGKTEFTNLPSGGLIVQVDNENGVITEQGSGYDLYDCFNFGFLEMEPGDNTLVLTGTGAFTISGRYLYNVGA